MNTTSKRLTMTLTTSLCLSAPSFGAIDYTPFPDGDNWVLRNRIDLSDLSVDDVIHARRNNWAMMVGPEITFLPHWIVATPHIDDPHDWIDSINVPTFWPHRLDVPDTWIFSGYQNDGGTEEASYLLTIPWWMLDGGQVVQGRGFQTIPEAPTMTLAGMGLLGLIGWRRR